GGTQPPPGPPEQRPQGNRARALRRDWILRLGDLPSPYGRHVTVRWAQHHLSRNRAVVLWRWTRRRHAYRSVPSLTTLAPWRRVAWHVRGLSSLLRCCAHDLGGRELVHDS